MAFFFKLASSAEVIRSQQKDDFYISFLRSSVADVIQNVAGPAIWIRWRKELDMISDLLYFILTTFYGYQTIGEEYVNVIMTDWTKRILPSKLRRGLMIGLQVCMPYFITWFLNKLTKQLESGGHLPFHMSGRMRDVVIRFIPALRNIITLIFRFNVSLFFMKGVFYHIAKRVLGIYYVTFSSNQSSNRLSPTLQLLGYLSMVQLVISSAVHLQSALQSMLFKDDSGTGIVMNRVSPRQTTGSGAIQPNLRCSLCFGHHQHPTLTVCGHLFCWKCIHTWCQHKGECPLCRERIQPSRLVALQNYDSAF